MVRLQDGPALRSPGPGASRPVCGKLEARHNYGTTGIEDSLKLERDRGFEPPTFSLGS